MATINGTEIFFGIVGEMSGALAPAVEVVIASGGVGAVGYEEGNE